ncbi:ALP1-like protein isoform X1 [Tanacetum coccineum]|uniref:ALP1-like protein isoform X1 n=1 Tax=Tanacetum coccineum TaxID=301880 RepID=A0ABQ4XF76_9ASTR
MARPLFNEIVTAVIDHDAYFRNNIDCTGKEGIFGLLKCTSSIPSNWTLPRLCCFSIFEETHGDINVLYQSPLFNDLKTGRAPEIPFVANGVTYPSGYYLVDGIYPELAPLVKMIPEPADDAHKRILYKQKQESARKDVERAFGVLKRNGSY